MTFSLAGSIVTQSGTDANLSALSGVAGVTTVSMQSGRYVIYYCAYRFDINGSLTIDPEREMLCTTYVMPSTGQLPIVNIKSGGTITVGVSVGPVTTKRRTKGTGIVITDDSQISTNDQERGRITVRSGGGLNLYAGIEIYGGEVFFESGSNINISDGSVFCTNPSSATNINNIRSRSSTVSVSSLKTNYSYYLMNGVQPIAFSGLSGQGVLRGNSILFYGTAAGNITATNYVVDGYAKDPSTDHDVEFIDSARARMRNVNTNSTLGVRNWGVGPGSEARTAGYVSAVHQCAFGAKVSGNQVDACCFVRDADSSVRKNLNGIDDTSDKTYLWKTSSGLFPAIQEVVTEIWNKAATGDSGNIQTDYRFGTQYSAQINCKSYIGLPAQSSYKLRGPSAISDYIVQLIDSSVTSSEATAVALLVSAVSMSTAGAGTITVNQSISIDELYDAIKAWGTRPVLSQLEFPSSSQMPAANVGGVFTTGMHVVVSSGVVLSAGSKMTSLSTTATVSGPGAVSCQYTDALGRHVAITSSTLTAGTLVQVWDVTAAAELYVGTPAGALSLPVIYTTDKTLRLRAMQCGTASATKFVEMLGALTSAGASFLVTQDADTVYAANAIDGSAVTGITIDDTLMRIEVTAGHPAVISGVPVRTISWAEIYAYETYWLSTTLGIRDEGRIITAVDPANYILVNFKIRNDTGYPLVITGGWGRDSITGESMSLVDPSGGTIIMTPDAVIAYGLQSATPAEVADAVLSAAALTPISADLQRVRGQAIDGAGTESDPWGPA